MNETSQTHRHTESKMSYYYYYYNASSSATLVKDQMMMTPLRVKQQQQQRLHPSLLSQPKMKPVTRKVPVVHYLSRNGQLEHPHFMEVILSAPYLYHLYLKDVMERLTALRGPDMPARYSCIRHRIDISLPEICGKH